MITLPDRLKRHISERQEKLKERQTQLWLSYLEENPEWQKKESLCQRLGAIATQLELRNPGSPQATEALQKLEDNQRLIEEEKQRVFSQNPLWSCPQCRDTGVLENELCPCVLPYIGEREERLGLGFQVPLQCHWKTFDLNLFTREQSPDWYDGQCSPRAAMDSLKAQGEQWLARFNEQGIQAYLFGRTGTGKTWFVSALAGELREKGVETILISAQGFHQIYSRLTVLEKMYAPDPEELDLKRRQWQAILTVPCLVIDDLASELLRAEEYAPLMEILSQRPRRPGAATLMTSNLTPEELGQYYDERLLSRLLGEFDLFFLDGPDLRREKALQRLQQTEGKGDQ